MACRDNRTERFAPVLSVVDALVDHLETWYADRRVGDAGAQIVHLRPTTGALRRWSAGRGRWWRVRGGEQSRERCLPGPGVREMQCDAACGAREPCGDVDEGAA